MAGPGRPLGRTDNPYNKRQRTETEEEKNNRIQKAADTRKKNKAAVDASKRAAAVQAFFQPRNKPPTAQQNTFTAVNNNDPGVPNDDEANTPKENDTTIDNQAVNIVPAANVIANLDIDEDDSLHLNDEDQYLENDDGGVQQEYVKSIQMRLRDEVSTKNNSCTDRWLLAHLEANDWWIRKENMLYFVKKLGLRRSYAAYYRDVYVWLPDIRWGKVCVPCCPSCKSNEYVGNNGFQDKHFGRLIIGLKENYYTISRRYICYACQTKSKDVESAVDQAFALNEHVSVEKTIDKVQYTFMGWNKHSLPLFPFGYGLEFPALLTWKAGVDKVVVDMMRPLFDKGLKPESFSNMLLELHTAEFGIKSLKHEYEIRERKSQHRLATASNEKFEPLGDFADKLKYRGVVPTGRYLIHVYKSFHETIRQYLAREVKKRDMDVIMIDVSYKEAKSLYQYRGKSVFRGLVTGLNQYGEVRIQFHIYTDSHEQMLAALEEFEKTRMALGFKGVSHVISDNPKKDKALFMNAMPSVKAQQVKYDSQQPSGTTTTGKACYNPDHLLIRVASNQTDINRVIDAMREDINGDTIGLDAEWNRMLDSRGFQTGRGRIQWIQIAYRNKDDNIRVLLLWVGDLKSLPNSLQSLVCDSTIRFAGVKVSGDLKYIGEDFNVKSIKDVEQKKRDVVVNLGSYAKDRGVVRNANTSLRHLVEITLDVTIDKTLQTSTWTKELTEDQKKYIAIDAAASLQVYEELTKMKDLSRRLNELDAVAGTAVDIVPSNGSSMAMATRSATGTIVGTREYICPVGFTYNGKRSIKIGKRAYVVKIRKIYAPNLVIPRFRYKKNKASVTLSDLGEIEIVVSLDMLMDHDDCASFCIDESRQTETADQNPVTSAATVDESSPNRSSSRGRVPRVYHAVDGHESEGDDFIDGTDGTAEAESPWEVLEDTIDSTMNSLTSADIETLRAAIFESKETEQGKVPLCCDKLDAPPKPEQIVNRYSSILGDVFHAMDRAKVPVKHEAKKGYFVALREAMLPWDVNGIRELETKMRESGMEAEEIEAQKYYNARLFRECVQRRVPPPNELYWRVRAVYALYGNIVDSKTKKPLFNKKAWKKANNVLLDILAGYYSDPPDLDFYTKKLGKSGEVVQNRYGLDVVECFRGTNRTESYHKNLTVTFGRWHVGIEMSDCLLAERRHRHNHKCSERRRHGFPIVGHFNTWIIDQLQNLVRENHGIQLYPHWTNASDYKTTGESFDTIALHHSVLHNKLEEKCSELGDTNLTREQEYMCKAMGTSLPFLPFVSKEERKAYAQYVLESAEAMDYDKAAEDWLSYVDGKNIMPKLPSHLRTHDESWSRNRRVKECVKNAKDGKKRLEELNAAISPGIEAALFKEPALPNAMPHPDINATENADYQVVAGILIGDNPIEKVVGFNNKRRYRCAVCQTLGCAGAVRRAYCPTAKAKQAGLPEPTEKIYSKQCSVCAMWGPKWLNCGIGSTKRDRCKYFEYGTGNKRAQY